ncbi:MAG: bile acid:sodium symporter family protein [Chitinophagales bacterium]|jgi:BASS family bile acid:Na+ symporter|nr:bile acid:sodium symporter family protein [Chitinophagales bacterium]
MSSLDQVQINASGDGLIVLKICLAFILFSLAIDIKKEDFITLYSNPKSVIVGCISQIIILPLFTFILVLLLKPSASIALGMLLVAACPCGNMSTYMSYLAKGFIPLSITITAISTLSASFTTPFNFYFYASHYEPAKVLLQEIHLSFFYLLSSIFLLLVLPLITGIALKAYFPRFIDKINKPVKISALLFFIALLMGAFITNRNVFYEHLPEIFGIICLQNFLAFIIGYFFSKLFKLPETHCRSISIETGIHNSGLGLILVMTFFNGNGGMALIAAWWGIWHIVTGGLFSLYWNKKAIE